MYLSNLMSAISLLCCVASYYCIAGFTVKTKVVRSYQTGIAFANATVLAYTFHCTVYIASSCLHDWRDAVV